MRKEQHNAMVCSEYAFSIQEDVDGTWLCY